MMKQAAKTKKVQHNQIKVWSLPVRLFHWCLVACFFSAYFLAESYRDVHEYLGYVVLALVVFRMFLGLFGDNYARFSSFFPTPSRLFPYLKDLIRAKEPRYLGHNPAAAVMILFLLSMCFLITLTGVLMTQTEWGWGNELLESLHVFAVDTTLVAVALHVSAAIYESIHHKENLIKSMFSGYKCRERGDKSID